MGKGRQRPQERPTETPRGLAERARRIERDMVALGREIATALGFASGQHEQLRRLPVRFALDLEDGGDGEGLLGALMQELTQIRDGQEAFAAGRVRCFQCASTDCVHARPPDGRHVFFRYGATGKPVWKELTEACLAWGEERVDVLHADPPGLLVVQRAAAELNEDLIAGFGKNDPIYSLLGEVVCGYFRLTPDEAGADERGAYSVHVVGSKRPGGLRLRLNVIGPERSLAGHEGFPEWWNRHALRDAVREARDRLRALELRTGGKGRRIVRREVEAEVDAILNRLRTAIERLHRPRSHRTRHAQARQLGGDRPTHTALTDAVRAADDRVLFEPGRGTVIVLGPKGRVHVFSPDGRHVTSLHHRRESIDRKVDREQWVPCEEATARTFRAAVRGFLDKSG